MNAKYLACSFLSGAVWGGIAYFLGREGLGSSIWAGVVLAPVIGVVVGIVTYPTYRWPIWLQVFASLFTLYASATAFGLILGVYEVSRWQGVGDRFAPMIELTLGTLYGTTMFVPLLWPLAFLNHFVLGPLRSRNPEAQL